MTDTCACVYIVPGRQITLQSADENRIVMDSLEQRFLRADEIQSILRGTCTELEMEG